ncbi:hypothetical protein APR50_01595 [Variovorax paradoxus]|jgi:hypothetical protein|uniref:hypothetical protein n=1 Tax=Variovorax paradoxus TaxID=34073 RepID=UPI0006E5A47B|nr:hypothetical protein APR52_09135 [Variovorax paradoxus]KPV12267.1 hypothetical protein APR50_01595 [Variovorax paradoxus]KPV14019.1 hypothetical protein APR49_00275 [Variovorax paradoxus]KPV22706.1 hypothetical protein APR51_09680 [Variovorax paradoxus]KPV34082.1 hypothetical protein APR48_08620 [Variovorax paradoxus]
MTGVGPVFHRFSVETLGQLRDVVRQYVPDSSYAAEEEAARIRAWHDISESEMELSKMIPRAAERFRLRRRDCDGLIALLAPNRTLPAFVRRDTSQ